MSSKTESVKADTATKIAESIIALLKKGVSPWHMPWDCGGGQLPLSAEGRAYRGINVMVLAMEGLANGYKSPYWLTFRKAMEVGGNVRKGERGTLVMYWHRNEYEVKDKAGNPILDENGDPVVKRGMLIRGYHVFNADQCDGLPEKFHPAPPKKKRVVDMKEAEAVWEGYEDRPTLTRGNRCAYSPKADKIIMPPKEAFDSMPEYYASLFHEACHSTGHETRLNRDMKNYYGGEEYGKEELIAEIGAQFLCQQVGITRTLKNAAAYCKSWARAIKSMPNHERAIVCAAAQAQKAADWILGNRKEGDK